MFKKYLTDNNNCYIYRNIYLYRTIQISIKDSTIEITTTYADIFKKYIVV